MLFKQAFEQFECKVFLFHLGNFFQEILIKKRKFRAFGIEYFHHAICFDCDFEQLRNTLIYDFRVICLFPERRDSNVLTASKYASSKRSAGVSKLRQSEAACDKRLLSSIKTF